MPSNLWYEPDEYLQMKCYLITPPTLQPAETSGEKCYVRPLKSLLKIVQRNANFNFKLWNRLGIKKSKVDLEEKQLRLEKKVLSCPNLCVKPFFAVNWYHAIFFHSFVLLAFFALWVTDCQASDLWMDSFHGKWPITSLYFRSHELYLVHGCSFNPLCKHYVEAVVRCYKLRCNFLASLEGNLFKCLFVKRVWNFFLSWAYYLA